MEPRQKKQSPGFMAPPLRAGISKSILPIFRETKQILHRNRRWADVVGESSRTRGKCMQAAEIGPNPENQIIVMITDPKEDKTISEWLSKAMVISPIGKSSHAELHQFLTSKGFLDPKICLLGENCFVMTLKIRGDTIDVELTLRPWESPYFGEMAPKSIPAYKKGSNSLTQLSHSRLV